MSIDIQVTVQVRDDGEAVGPAVIEHIPLGRILAGLDRLRSDHHTVQVGRVLASMTRCAFADEEVFRTTLAAIWDGEA